MQVQSSGNQAVQQTSPTQKKSPNLTVVVNRPEGGYKIEGDKIDLRALQQRDERLATQLSLYDQNQDGILEATEINKDKPSLIRINFATNESPLYKSSERAALIEYDENGQIIQSPEPQQKPVEQTSQLKIQPEVPKETPRTNTSPPPKNEYSPNMPGATVVEEVPQKQPQSPPTQPETKPNSYNHGLISIDASKTSDTELQWALQLLERVRSTGYRPTPVENKMYEKIMQNYIIPGATP